MRKKTRVVKVGNIAIGGENPVAVQSMLNIPVSDVESNVQQAKRLENAGCQLIRVTVPAAQDAEIVTALKKAVNVPIVADIHFDYRAALACVDAGVDKIRINPGNIGSDERVRLVAQACKEHGIPIRIGVNGGSLEKDILAKYGKVTPEALVESALYHVSLLEKHDFHDIVISIKSSNVPIMMQAYRLLSEKCDYPLHIGVTEAGTYRMGLKMCIRDRVTPTSQIVGTQAVFNVILGERYKMVTKEFKGLVHGDYGKTPAPISPEFTKQILGDEQPITCRFADTLEPEMDKLKAEAAKWVRQEEDVLTYAMFPQVAPKFFEKRNNKLMGVDLSLIHI